jgi:RNA polymerase sigma-70 factor (ECF subfamily)
MAQAAPEADVVALAIGGDVDAFTEIYKTHSARVFRHLNYLLGDRAEADDLTNETFLRAWKVIDRYEDRGLRIENWLLKIGHNLAVRQLKKKRPTHDIESLTIQDAPEARPESIAEMASEALEVRQAILKLPDIPRQVIIWRFLEGMDYEEIEKMLGKSNGAIRVIQFRALKQLRIILEAQEAAGGQQPASQSGWRAKAGALTAGSPL